MVSKDWSYKEVQKKARAIKELGIEEIYLSEGDYPWELADSIEAGGSHRLDIATSVWFRAIEPVYGIAVRWSFDIEPSSANGKGTYQIDIEGCRRVRGLLNGNVRNQFEKYLADCAVSIQKQIDELLDAVSKEQLAVQALTEAIS